MSRKTLFFFSIITLITVSVAIKQFATPILKIETINCQLDNDSCPEELTQKIETLAGNSFLFSKLDQEISSLELDFYQLVSVSKNWPSTINLIFSNKPTSYHLKIDQKETTYLISETGFAREIDAQQNIGTTIFNQPDVIQDNRLDPQLHQVLLKLNQDLGFHKIEYQLINFYHPDQIEIVINSTLVAVVQETALGQQISKLSIILSELDFNSIDTAIKEIDLRFKLPVLKTNRSTPS